VAELAPRLGVRAACDALGIAQASYYRRHRTSPEPARPAPITHRDRPQPPALSADEAEAILDESGCDRRSCAWRRGRGPAGAGVVRTRSDRSAHPAARRGSWRRTVGAGQRVPGSRGVAARVVSERLWTPL